MAAGRLLIAVVGLFAMLIWDIVDKSAQFTTAIFLIFLVIAVWALRWHNPAATRPR